ncbi:hypothetical protein AA313_de0206424 [Arthrobotrys entomopaga]|nr:hypothetical protein AA313_de0206424 [Arthrobotrys entomopaga]
MASNCPCGTPPGMSKQVKKEDKATKYDRSRAGSHTLSIPATPAEQHAMNSITYAFPNGFLPNMEHNGLMSLDQSHVWQTQGFNTISNLQSFPSPMDLGSPGGPQFYPSDVPPGMAPGPMVKPQTKKSCCKPDPSISSVEPKNFIDATASTFPGIQPLPPNNQYSDFPKDQRSRRHTADIYPRKRVSLGSYQEVDMRQFNQAPEGRSTSVPNVMVNPGMMHSMQYGNPQLGPVSEDTQNPAYTILTAQRYNQNDLMYMNAIRQAHERQQQQQQEEADNTRRANQASEHAQKLSGGNCCPPADNNGLQYALPHGQECQCGPNCSCIMCVTHPYNSATIEYIRNIHETLQNQEQGSEEHSPSTQGFAHSVAESANFPSGGGVGVFGDVALDNMSEEKDILGIQTTQLSPSAFIQLDYNLGTCSQQNGTCLCGDGCTCVGCLTHSGHSGLNFMENPMLLSQPVMTDQGLNDAPDPNSQGAQQPAPNDGSEAVWKTEEPTTGWKTEESTTDLSSQAPPG